MHYQGGLEAATVVAWIDKHRVAAWRKLHRARVKAYGSGERLNNLGANSAGFSHELHKDGDGGCRRTRNFAPN